MRVFSVPQWTLGPLCCTLLLVLAACSSAPPAASATATPTTPPATPTPTPIAPILSTAVLKYTGHTAAVVGLAWSPDGKLIASGADDGTVQVWDAQTGKQSWTTKVERFIFAVAWSPDGKKIASGGLSGAVTVLNAANGAVLATYTGQSGAIQGLAWSPDGRKLASGSQDGTVLVRWRDWSHAAHL